MSLIRKYGRGDGKRVRCCLELCNRAAALLRAAGFEFRYASMKTEACYYGWPGRKAVLRVAAHRFTGHFGADPVAAKITFRADTDYDLKMKISLQKADLMVASAIGVYLITTGERL